MEIEKFLFPEYYLSHPAILVGIQYYYSTRPSPRRVLYPGF